MEIEFDKIEKKLVELESQVDELRKHIILARLKCLSLKPTHEQK